MSLTSYPIIKQYLWYYKKLNTHFFSKTIPILHIDHKYCIYYTDAHMKSFDKLHLCFSQKNTLEFEKNKYYIGIFTYEDHNDIVNKLRKVYNIEYIDVDDNLIWKQRHIKNTNNLVIKKIVTPPEPITLPEPVTPEPVSDIIEQNKIEDYYSVAVEIINSSGIKKYHGFFDEDDFIVVNLNDADL